MTENNDNTRRIDDKTLSFINQWNECVEKAQECLLSEDFTTYSKLMEKADTIKGDYKDYAALRYECKNFGLANYIFEDALPKLFLSKDKSCMREFIRTIKEDKNLSTEFKFYKSLKDYDKDITDAQSYISEALSILDKSLDKKTLKESNKKLSNIIKKYNIRPSERINGNDLALFEACDYLFSHERNLANLAESQKRINTVKSYLNEELHVEENNEKPLTFEDFERKYNSLLSEDEKSFVQELMMAKRGSDLKKQNSLFETLKKECVKLIDKGMGNADEDEKEGLHEIREQLLRMAYNESTVVKDIAKLLEIRDILA